MTHEEILSLGFKQNPDIKSMYTGKLTTYTCTLDNGHVLRGHDTSLITLEVDNTLVITETCYNSYNNGGSRVLFAGMCNSIGALEKLLNATLSNNFKKENIL